MKLHLNDKDYHFPDRLLVRQWIDLMAWEFDNPIHWPRIIAIVTGAPLNLLQQAPKDGLELAVAMVYGLMEARAEATFKDPTQLKFGEFVDLEIAFATGVERSLADITNILAPEIGYSDEALYVVEKYAEYRSSLLRQYANLFGTEDHEDSDEEVEIVPDPFAAQRAWYRIIVGLANEDVLKLDAVVEEPVIKILNFMALQKQKTLEENARILEQKRKYDLQANRR